MIHWLKWTGVSLVSLSMMALAGCGVATPSDDFEAQSSGLTKGRAGAQNGDGDYCNDPAFPCASGEGDCDTDAQCAGALICGVNNGPKFGFGAKWDVCVPAHCENGQLDAADGETLADCGGPCGACPNRPGNNGDRDYCDDPAFPCSTGEGDCDTDAQCAGALICGLDNGPKFGMPRGYDVCIPASCQNGQKDANELDVDCGGDCGACEFPNHCYNDQLDVADGEVDVDCGGPCDTCADLALEITAPSDCQLFRTSRPSFAGTTNAGQLVTLELDGFPLTTTLADGNGQWQFDAVVDIPDGAHSLVVRVDRGADMLEETVDFNIDTLSTGDHVSSATYGGNSESAIYEVDVDAANNTYISGFFAGTADFGGGELEAQGRHDGVVARYDAAGQLSWLRTYGITGKTKPEALVVHPSGGVIVGGYFDGQVDFGTGPVTAQARDAFIMHVDASGATQWVRVFAGTGSNMVERLDVNAAGEIAAIGQFQNSVDFGGGAVSSAGDFDIFMLKLDANGNTLFSRTFGGTARDTGYGVALTPTGGVAIGGLFRQTVNFGGADLNAADATPGRHSAFIAQYDATGAHQWSKRIGGKDYDAVRTLAVDGNGDVVVGGFFYFTGDFGGGPIAATSGYDLFLAKYTSAGEYVWANALQVSEYNEMWQLRIDGANNIVTTGVFSGSVNFGGASFRSAGSYDSFIAKYASCGAHIWSQAFGGRDRVNAYTVALDGTGQAVVGGFFQGTANFGDGDVTALGYRNVFLKRVAP